LLENLGARLDGPVAQALYVAISCATDSFQNDLVTPGTHTRVARLMESGMPADRLARRLFREDSLGFLRLLGKVLAGLRVALGGRLVLGEVSWAELRCSEPEADLPQRLARRIDQVRGGELVVLMCEQEDGTFRGVPALPSPSGAPGGGVLWWDRRSTAGPVRVGVPPGRGQGAPVGGPGAPGGSRIRPPPRGRAP